MTEPDPALEPLTSVPRAQRTLGRAPDSTEDLEALQDVVEAVCSLVPTWLEVPAGGWAAHHHLGATLLAVRLFRRRDSPGGFAQFGLEGASYVQGNWPDVAMLLGVGAYAVGRTG